MNAYNPLKLGPLAKRSTDNIFGHGFAVACREPFACNRKRLSSCEREEQIECRRIELSKPNGQIPSKKDNAAISLFHLWCPPFLDGVAVLMHGELKSKGNDEWT